LHARGDLHLDLFLVVAKDLDEMTSSIDVSSNEEHETVQGNTEVPAIVVTGMTRAETLDDVDDDEAFISELMAMHPNDEDIQVEDLEGDGDMMTIQEGLRTTDEVERALNTPETVEGMITPEPPTDEEDGDGVSECGCWLLVSPIALVFAPGCFALLPSSAHDGARGDDSKAPPSSLFMIFSHKFILSCFFLARTPL
jgi:hypothetical protein